MKNMNDSMAYADSGAARSELPSWKLWAGGIAAVLLALLFIVAGVWKITDPIAASVRLAQAKVPHSLSVAAALGLGISELFAGVLLLVPRFRRWGAWLTGLLLAAFVVYIGYYYNDLRGEECNCFPWIKRAVGPAFFAGDAIMLALAAMAGWWAAPSRGFRNAALILGAICVFAFASLGIHLTRQTGARAPEYVMVDGKRFWLHEGRVFLYFFNPECPHCDLGARELAKLDWSGTKIVGVVTELPQFGPEFLTSTGLGGGLCEEAQTLRKSFSFVDVPYGVALVNGYQRASITDFESGAAAETLRRLGFVK
jgi:uncharacterized membrane protein YphA (DoxX/SURF4 family)/thiol-disulfide isomerase/thioredoxin